ncbi:hypothetical protein FOB58_000839 [Candida parapsilosis]|uniref:RNase III domain-containing protein n=2 Tax=Candida parapsilosis TaxID=5480 RepID=G8BGE9_CANPC|nr:uncharacterized protein CPAR2_205760 [Candida parapsilosis]KAF6054917.1 hypothetical protein FOB58_000839 [Candida parapsilosis]KAF6056059.1 hypothetical protein FOB59_000571 [Candida parapsilosis]KAF6058990.1 hypothetical protein FOB60_000572 [Candida parapsilosis]KAF6067747.1 hypothetical protein FOB61_000572 [Candida parapsilosis]KAI5905418.1 hypothetical protein K4G60_g4677 [Candida parapsilosis]
MRLSTTALQNTAIRLSPNRQISTWFLPKYKSFSEIYRKFKPSFLNHYAFIDNTKTVHFSKTENPGLLAQRDGPNILDQILKASSSDSRYEQHVEPLINYIDPVKLSNEELACVSNGLTNLELRVTNEEGKVVFIETDLLRRLGKQAYALALINQFKIFQNMGYLSNSETDIDSDITWLLDNKIILEFMNLNGLSKCVSMNSELLINEYLNNTEFEDKKRVVLNATTIGSFYTLIGLTRVRPRPGSQDLMNKIINGKRGVFNILKQNA